MARKIEALGMAKARSDTLSLLVLAGQLLVGTVRNLLAVTAGNILGGTVLVARVYGWPIYPQASGRCRCSAREGDTQRPHGIF